MPVQFDSENLVPTFRSSIQSDCKNDPFQFDWEVLALILIVVLTYFVGLSGLPLRGEESRWAQVGVEMIASGNWVVPTQQGLPFLSRPPLGSWLIAIATLCRGECDLLAVRLPTVIATLLTTMLIYCYSRTFLSRAGALASAAAFATMGQVLQLGGLAETEAVFTFFVGSSLLVWHLFAARDRFTLAWILGYTFVGLGALTKGSQAPVYFVGCTGMFLLVTGSWRQLFGWPHLLGICCFAAILGAWQVPFFQQLGWQGTRKIWGSDVALRFVDNRPATVIQHLLLYPFEVIACMLPWSALVVAFLRRPASSWRSLPPQVKFLITCLVVTFPSCWIPPGARGRYFMPLYPCFAPLTGLALDALLCGNANSKWQELWNVRKSITIWMVAGGSAILLAVRIFADKNINRFLPPMFDILCCSAGALTLAAILYWTQRTNRIRLEIVAFALLVSLSYRAIFQNALIQSSEDASVAIAKLKQQLPIGKGLVSYGPIHHLFAFHFRDPISLTEWNSAATVAAETSGMEYFCYDPYADQTPKTLPFSWEEVAYISCDRVRGQRPTMGVIVGRRLPQVAAELPRPMIGSANPAETSRH